MGSPRTSRARAQPVASLLVAALPVLLAALLAAEPAEGAMAWELGQSKVVPNARKQAPAAAQASRTEGMKAPMAVAPWALSLGGGDGNERAEALFWGELELTVEWIIILVLVGIVVVVLIGFIIWKCCLTGSKQVKDVENLEEIKLPQPKRGTEGPSASSSKKLNDLLTHTVSSKDTAKASAKQV